ncbi:hypothetical protein M3Y99_00906300 [Aphelenchoides fujianensis]|nr:hypothetical protein M3Y99_00906300 [Aphelenchoides fujianensis]
MVSEQTIGRSVGWCLACVKPIPFDSLHFIPLVIHSKIPLAVGTRLAHLRTASAVLAPAGGRSGGEADDWPSEILPLEMRYVFLFVFVAAVVCASVLRHVESRSYYHYRVRRRTFRILPTIIEETPSDLRNARLL